MADYVVYVPGGEIIRSGSCTDADIDLQVEDGESVLEGYGTDTGHWVDEGTGVIRLKQPMGLLLVDVHIIADGEDFSIIHGVPAGVSVSVNGTDPVPVTDGEVKFKTVDVGNHSLVFTGVPYVTEEVIVGAV